MGRVKDQLIGEGWSHKTTGPNYHYLAERFKQQRTFCPEDELKGFDNAI